MPAANRRRSMKFNARAKKRRTTFNGPNTRRFGSKAQGPLGRLASSRSSIAKLGNQMIREAAERDNIDSDSDNDEKSKESTAGAHPTNLSRQGRGSLPHVI